jgi:hypothetical protein
MLQATDLRRSAVIRIAAPAIAAMLALAGIASAAASPSAKIVVKLEAQPGSKISGTATITHVEAAPPVATVTIVLDGVFIPENQYPARVYNTACSNLGSKPEYDLTPVMSGRSETRLRPYATKPGPYVIAVFNTAGTHAISCGALPAMQHSH